MKTRFITGIIGIILLLGVIFSSEYIFGLVIFLLSVIAMKEYLDCFKNTVHKPIKSVSYISTLPLLLVVFRKYIMGIDFSAFLMGVYLLILMLAVPIVFRSDRYNISDIAITLFGVFYIPFLFSFIILTRSLEHGIYYIGVIFIGSCVTDIFAYLVGCSLGKHKLLPSVSPKKTIEGSIGGIIGTLIVMLVYGIYVSKYVDISLQHFIIIGVITSVVSQLGDLFASSIKRYVKIKDYGKILPGHGGILDRVDSIIFIVPIVYFYFSTFEVVLRHG